MAVLIRLYSDFACPYCFVAEQSSLVRLQREYEVAVDWRGFELHPETPRGGMALAELMGAEQIASMQRSMESFARRFGVEGMRGRQRVPNTRWALALAEVARDLGKLDEFRHLAMEAHWRQGLDLEDVRDLNELATRAGLSDGSPEKALSDPQYLARVDAVRAESEHLGVGSIPTFFIGREKVVGCVPYEALSAAADRAGAALRTRDSSSKK
jgi:predicted DsbA family dithiol-disulfide isomerase